MSKIKQRLLALSILTVGFTVCLPIYKQMYKNYIKCSQKHLKPSFEIPAEPNKDDLPPSKSPIVLPQKLANNAEVIFISGYEMARNSDSDKVKVNIDRPNQNVLLVLTSYDPIEWEVEASQNTNITGILLSSYHASTVVNNTNSEVFSVELPYSYEVENKNFVAALKQLNQWFGIDRVDAFYGNYRLPNAISISELDSINPALTLAGYPIQEPTDNFKFNLYDCDDNSVRWTLKGAIDRNECTTPQTGIAISPDGTEIYQLTDTGIKITNKKTGKQQDFALPSKFPELSWGTDLAYDRKRDIVSLVSLGGQGYFYRFDVEKRRWLDVRSANNIDIKSLTYDPIEDRYLAWGGDYDSSIDGLSGSLLFISGNGELLSKENTGDSMKGFYRLYDRGNEDIPTIEIVANGNDIALIARKQSDWGTPLNGSIQSIWH